MVTTEISLVHFDRARQELALANSIDEVKQIRDQAEAIRQYVRQQNGGHEMQNQAAEIKLRAERRLGQMLQERPMNHGGLLNGKDNFGAFIMEAPNGIPKLNELGISHSQSHRWQLESQVPEEKFEQFIAETKAKGQELTSKAVETVARKIVQQARREELKSQPLPADTFNVVYADPPWQYDNTGVDGSAEHHYPTMPLIDIVDLHDGNGELVTDLFDDNCALFLWVTNPFLRDAFEVVDGWGFEYKTNIVWVKTDLTKPGSGFYVRGRHEILFICTKGTCVPDQTGKAPIGSVIEAPVQEHSRKPEVIYSIIENIYPHAKYLELFARQTRPGWTCWGNEVAQP